jgi:hypothetical protein
MIGSYDRVPPTPFRRFFAVPPPGPEGRAAEQQKTGEERAEGPFVAANHRSTGINPVVAFTV